MLLCANQYGVQELKDTVSSYLVTAVYRYNLQQEPMEGKPDYIPLEKWKELYEIATLLDHDTLLQGVIAKAKDNFFFKEAYTEQYIGDGELSVFLLGCGLYTN